MSIRNHPPKPARRLSVVTAHQGKPSVGHNVGTRTQKRLNKPQYDRGAQPIKYRD
jgi:hypothetical protein